MDSGRCKSCGADVFWVTTAATGRPIPLNTKPERRFVINSAGKAQIVETYVSHFATCPQANRWRKAKRK